MVLILIQQKLSQKCKFGETEKFKIKIFREGVPSCRYTTAMARTNTIENLKKLEMESNGVKVEVSIHS